MKKRYLHYLIFVILFVSTLLNWSWPWGVFFILWTIPAYYSGSIFFIDHVERKKEPIFYWAIFITWILLGITMVLVDIPFFSQYLTAY